MSRHGPRPRGHLQHLVALAACGCLTGGLLVAACEQTATPAPSPAQWPAAPLTTTFSTSAGGWAVVAMGALRQPLNTFWQLLHRQGPQGQWSLATPPGVADNGGLVVTSGAPTALTAAFEPSQELRFSPISQSVDGGGTWTAGLVPTALAQVPDALAASPGGGLLALVRRAGGQVLAGSAGSPDWHTVVDHATLSTSSAGRSCGVGTLTAVAAAPSGPLVGTSCARPGVVGVFARGSDGWHLVGPPLPVPLATEQATLLRLVPEGGDALCALVGVGGGSRAGIFVMWSDDGGDTWTLSGVLDVGRSDALVSIGFAVGGGVLVQFAAGGASTDLARVAGEGLSWQHLPSPPPHTAAVALTPDGGVDALAVQLVALADWRLGSGSTTWSRTQTMTVPIQFGSSS